MKSSLKLAGAFALGFAFALVAVAIAAGTTNADTTVLPKKISKADAAGAIFERADMNERTHGDGHKTRDVTTLLSSTGKFASGMYSSTKTRAEIKQPYGVDEFMFFVKGSVTLTSSDGSKMTVRAGEGVTIPKEWTGIWDTDGYEKIWVIYDETGKSLQ